MTVQSICLSSHRPKATSRKSAGYVTGRHGSCQKTSEPAITRLTRLKARWSTFLSYVRASSGVTDGKFVEAFADAGEVDRLPR